MNNTTSAALTTGTRVIITRGCNARGVTKGASAVVETVEPLGAEYSHSVKVVLRFQNSFLAGKTIVLFARHTNRLSDVLVSLNDGRPEHRIEVRRA